MLGTASHRTDARARAHRPDAPRMAPTDVSRDCAGHSVHAFGRHEYRQRDLVDSRTRPAARQLDGSCSDARLVADADADAYPRRPSAEVVDRGTNRSSCEGSIRRLVESPPHVSMLPGRIRAPLAMPCVLVGRVPTVRE